MRYKEMCYSNITTLLGKKLYNVLLLFLGGILPPPHLWSRVIFDRELKFNKSIAVVKGSSVVSFFQLKTIAKLKSFLTF